MLLKVICLILIINTNKIQSNSISDPNESNEFLSITSQVNELEPEQDTVDELNNDTVIETDPNDLKSFARDCAEATAISKTSGIYKILNTNYSKDPFSVVCDVTTREDVWTVILSRFDGSENFYRNWNTYKRGFGNLNAEFFLGLDKIHAITSGESQELLVLLEDFEGVSRYAYYDRFGIAGEDEQYALNTLGKASGNAGDSLTAHYTMKFSTFDRDNDLWEGQNCAETFTGAWWYKACHFSNLAGKYNDNSFGKGVNWAHFRGFYYSLKKATMMIRRKN